MPMPGLGITGAFQQQTGTDTPPPPAYEHRAQLYFDAHDSDDTPFTTEQKDCINDLLFEALGAAGYIDLSDDTGASDRWEVIHLLCIGSALGTRWNILRPIDNDASFRKVDFGGWVYSNTGQKPNGINAYSRTFWNYRTLGCTTKGSYIFCCEENLGGGGQVGVFDANTGTFLVALQGYQDQHMSVGQLPDYLGTAIGADSSGDWMATHRAVTDGENFRNGVTVNTISNILTLGVNGEIYYGARLVAGPNVIDQYDTRKHSLMGESTDGYSAAEALELRTIFRTFLNAWFAL